jgi:hypothetical protein
MALTHTIKSSIEASRLKLFDATRMVSVRTVRTETAVGIHQKTMEVSLWRSLGTVHMLATKRICGRAASKGSSK